MQILELPQDVHPFFLGTQAHPELTSRPLRPSPMFMGLVQAAIEFAEKSDRVPQARQLVLAALWVPRNRGGRDLWSQGMPSGSRPEAAARGITQFFF